MFKRLTHERTRELSFGRVAGGRVLYFVPTPQVAESEKYPAPSRSSSELSLAVDDRVRVQVILYRVGPGTGGRRLDLAERPPAAPRSPARSEPAGRRPGPEPPAPRRAAAPEGGKHLPRELLLQLPQALPGGLHVPQELGYFIVLGFGQLHASHRLTPRRRAWAAAGGAKGASDAAPVPGTAAAPDGGERQEGQ